MTGVSGFGVWGFWIWGFRGPGAVQSQLRVQGFGLVAEFVDFKLFGLMKPA